jgi:hypothetical protein
LTGTVEAQSANPSFTVTLPLATRCLRRRSVIVRAWIVGSITVKTHALVAVPPGVVTAIGPVVARAGTVAVILVSEATVKVARVPLNLTAEAPAKPAPMIVTDVPTVPLVGLNDVRVGTGDGVTVKFVALATVVPCLVTEIGPVVAPAGTMAVICEFEFTVNVALVPLNRTGWRGETHAGDHDRRPDHAAGRVERRDRETSGRHREVGRTRGRATGRRHRDRPGRGSPGDRGRDLGVRVHREGRVGVVELHRGRAEEARSRDLHGCSHRSAGGIERGDRRDGRGRHGEFVALVAVPSGFVTEMAPLVAPAGTVAVIVCVLLIMKVAETPLNRTAVTSGSGPLKLSPVISTGVPTGPLVGVNDEMVGAAANAASAPGMAIVSPTSRTTKEVWAARRRIHIMTPPSQSGRCTDP